MAKTGTASAAPQRASKDLEKASEKARTQPGAKPPDKDAKHGMSASLPDAALLDDADGEGDESATAPAGGLTAWLPTGPRRWIVVGCGTIGLIVVCTIAAVTAAAHFRGAPVALTPRPDVVRIAGTAQALDGATVTVAGQTLRLEDIDAPPASLVCRQGAWQYRCGDEARRGLINAIGRGPVECIRPHEDAKGRLTAQCTNDTGLDIAAIQVETGWAVNDTKVSSRYVAEEMRARSKGNGLWRDDFAIPELWHNQLSAGH